VQVVKSTERKEKKLAKEKLEKLAGVFLGDHNFKLTTER